MRQLLLGLALCLPMAAALAQAADGFVVERTLWIKPGRNAQYVALFERVERPRLEALRKEGKVLWYRIAQPVLPARNDDWGLRATVAWRSAADAAAEQQARADLGRGNATERVLLEELVTDQQAVWVREMSAGP